jgi:hypothetical protein
VSTEQLAIGDLLLASRSDPIANGPDRVSSSQSRSAYSREPSISVLKHAPSSPGPVVLGHTKSPACL